MTPQEASLVLAKLAAFDRRTVGEMEIRAWADALQGISVADALEAVSRHYRDTRDFAMPADVIGQARKLVKERGEQRWAALQRGVPDADPNDVTGWLRAVRQGRTRPYREELPARPVRAALESVFRNVVTAERK